MSKRKPYNPAKTFALQIQNACFVSFTSEHEGDDKICVTNIASSSLRDAVVEWRGNWLVQLGLIYRMPDGSFDSKETLLIARGKRINDLTDTYQAEKMALLDNANPNLTVDFGWVIRPLSKRLERKVNEDREQSVLEKWLERRDQFARKTMEGLK